MKNSTTLIDRALDAHRVPFLSGSYGISVPSPYFQTTDLRKEAPDRDTNISVHMKALIAGLIRSGGTLYVSVVFINSSGTTVAGANIPLSLSSSGNLPGQAGSQIVDYASTNLSITIAESDVIWSVNDTTDSQMKIQEFSGTVAGGSGAVSIDISGAGFSVVSAVVWTADDEAALYSFGSESASTSTVSCVLKKQSTASANALINLLGGLTSVVTGVSQVNASNGATVRALVVGS